MPLCTGGLSEPKTGLPSAISLGSSGTGLLAAIPRFAKLSPYANALGIVSIALTDLCSVEPPGFPTFTDAEVEALAQLDFTPDYFSGLGKLRDAVKTAAWYQFCQCHTGSTPSQPTPAVQPDPPALLPTEIPNTSATCQTNAPFTQVWNATLSGYVNRNISRPDLVTNPVGTSFTLTTTPHVGGVGITSHWEIKKHSLTGANAISLFTFNMGVSETRTFSIDYDPVYPIPRISGDIDTYSNPGEDVTVQSIVTCVGQPAVGPASCCPPDPQVLAQLASIQATVTLLQRQLAPFAYIAGEVDAGLSGDGEIGVQGLLGFKVHVTTLPGRVGLVDGTPETRYDLGWLRVGTSDGWQGLRYLDTEDALWIPPNMSAITRIGYTFTPGVVATLTQLVREA